MVDFPLRCLIAGGYWLSSILIFAGKILILFASTMIFAYFPWPKATFFPRPSLGLRWAPTLGLASGPPLRSAVPSQRRRPNDPPLGPCGLRWGAAAQTPGGSLGSRRCDARTRGVEPWQKRSGGCFFICFFSSVQPSEFGDWCSNVFKMIIFGLFFSCDLLILCRFHGDWMI